MATTYSMDEEKKKEYDMNYGIGDFPKATADPYPSEAKTQDKKAQSAFIKTERGTLARRGTATAQRAENREKNRERAKQMARDRKAKKAKTKQVKIA